MMVRKFKDFMMQRHIRDSLIYLAAGMLFIFCFIKDPREYTISTIGLDHPVLFFILCTTLSVSTLTSTLYLTDRAGYKNRLYRALVWIYSLAFIVTALTTTKRTGFETALHWITAMMYMACMPMMYMWLGIYRIIKGEKKLIIALIIFHAIYFGDTAFMLWSFITQGPHNGKNGIMEIIPLFLTFILLLLACNTDLFLNKKDKEKEEVSDG